MQSIRNYNKTGERFWNEGEYADSSGFIPPVGGSPTPLPYASQENNNKVYAHPSDAQQQHLYQRKPIDCGSIKILSNNISHLAYQKCRTLAVLNGPGTIGYKYSDRVLQAGSPLQNVIDITFPGWTSGLRSEQYKEIGWSQYSSKRLGPFFSVTDRKFQYTDDGTPINLANNATCIRKMILVVSGYKTKDDTGPDDRLFRLHVVVTSDGSNPANPAASIIPISAEQRAWIQECDPAITGFSEGPIPWYTNTAAPERPINLQGRPAFSTTLDADDPGGPVAGWFTGHFKVFIPIDCIGHINNSNASYNSVEVFQYYVHLGWLSGNLQNAITNITLLEVRDPGSAEAS